MNRLFFTVVLATVTGLSLFAQNPNVSIKIDTAERFRFEGSRLNFLNPGRNVLIGDSAGYYMYNKAQGNVYIGDLTGLMDTTGMLNTFIGGQAGYSNLSGVRNTYLGFGAGQSNSTGSRNTFAGLWAGAYNTTGSYNTYIGRNAGFYNETGIGNVFIGNSAGSNELGSDRLYIANTNTSSPMIYGEFDNSYLKFNANNTVFSGQAIATGNIATSGRFIAGNAPGINDTVTIVTNMDFANSLLRYRTLIYKSGILVYTSNESAWVNAVGAPDLPCGPISMVGEFNDWWMDTFMIRSEADPAFWTGNLFLTTASDKNDPPDGIIEVKFRENASWDVSWGSTSFPNGIGSLGGPNIPVPLNPNFTTTIYYVTFNCVTGAYTFTDISQ